MNKVLFSAVALLAICAVASAVQYSELAARQDFDGFMCKHNKQYASPVEREARFQIFRANVQNAMELNEKAGAVAFGITKFSDMSPEELKPYLGYVPRTSTKKAPRHMPTPSNAVPESFDWRGKATTPVRDQGQCGSCWAFSAVAQVESAFLLKYGNSTGPETYMSTQQVVDCDIGGGDYGCRGGDTITAYAYLMKAKGIESEKTYPYTAKDETCKYKPAASVATVTGWEWTIPSCEHGDCTKQDENKLAQSMKARGPASICVAAANDWFSYTGPAPYAGNCRNGYYDLNHCVQLVGFQKTSESAGYWIARNSWGTSWGDKGYIYLPYGKNSCGLADEVTYVTVA